jgi:hypothetical protein
MHNSADIFYCSWRTACHHQYHFHVLCVYSTLVTEIQNNVPERIDTGLPPDSGDV